MGDNASESSQDTPTQKPFGNLTTEEKQAFDTFKTQCEAEGFLKDSISENGDDLKEGICDDGTLL
jgi:hypothetical protein